jgi:hypothetical protein
MSLRDSYFNGATGLQQQMDGAFDAGVAFVGSNLTALQTALESAAAQGKLEFKVLIQGTGTGNAVYLRGNNGYNLYLKSFFAGIINAMAAQEIYDYQVRLQLDISTSASTNVVFLFNFGTNTSTAPVSLDPISV